MKHSGERNTKQSARATTYGRKTLWGGGGLGAIDLSTNLGEKSKQKEAFNVWEQEPVARVVAEHI